MPSPQQLVALYRETAYDARLPGGLRASLRIGRPVPDSLRAWAGSEWPLVFISACNPRSMRLAAGANRIRMRALAERLDRLGLRRLAGVGHIVRRPWREPSFLVAGLALEPADRLAAEFDQDATVVALDPAATRLRIVRAAWRARIGEHGDILWAGN